MRDTDKIFCRIVLDILVKHGVTDIVCSPGSRNAPLLIGAAARQDFKKHIISDERSAAFFALGLAMTGREAVALVCTSGTAVLNYAPAVAEAYYQGLPLIVISADRPFEWIDQDDSQTIRQNEILHHIVKKSYDIPDISTPDETELWYVNRITNDALLTACSEKKGPVHINIRFKEPVGKKREIETINLKEVKLLKSDSFANREIIKDLAREAAGKKIMVTVGFMLPSARFQQAMTEFSNLPNVVIMAESISNLHIKDAHSIDSVLTSYSQDYIDKFRPDLIISTGGALVSRKLKEYLRRNKNHCQNWSIGHTGHTVDTFQSLSLRIETDPERFFFALGRNIKKYISSKSENFANDYNQQWRKLRKEALSFKDEFVNTSGWSELTVFNYILKNIPSRYNLFLSNGTPVRYAQLINSKLPHASYCNRGVSGIEGTLSTAIGSAVNYKGPTLLIIGDLSFTYEINALGMKNQPDDFKIIIIDNDGGNIFRFIPSTETLEEREDYFCNAISTPYRKLAEGYGWNYMDIEDLSTLQRMFGKFLTCKGKIIMRIKINGEESAKKLKEYMTIKTRKDV